MPETAAKPLDAIRADCRALVTRRSLMSAGAAVVPVPGLDMGTDVAILMQLLPQINQKFGLGPEHLAELSPEGEKMLLLSGASMGLGLIGRALTPERVLKLLINMGAKRVATKSMAKFVPLVGSGISAGVSYYLLRKVGYAHIEECYQLASRLAIAQAADEPARQTTVKPGVEMQDTSESETRTDPAPALAAAPDDATSAAVTGKTMGWKMIPFRKKNNKKETD